MWAEGEDRRTEEERVLALSIHYEGRRGVVAVGVGVGLLGLVSRTIPDAVQAP